MSDALAQLQAWYARQCNGSWEQRHGITIETIDNPGWWVKVDLIGTALERAEFADVSFNVDEEGAATADEWYGCHLEDGVWHGAGDPGKLPVILDVFLKWANTAGGQ